MSDDQAAQLARIERRLNNLGDAILASIAFIAAWGLGWFLAQWLIPLWQCCAAAIVLFMAIFVPAHFAFRH